MVSWLGEKKQNTTAVGGNKVEAGTTLFSHLSRALLLSTTSKKGPGLANEEDE